MRFRRRLNRYRLVESGAIHHPTTTSMNAFATPRRLGKYIYIYFYETCQEPIFTSPASTEADELALRVARGTCFAASRVGLADAAVLQRLLPVVLLMFVFNAAEGFFFIFFVLFLLLNSHAHGLLQA